jgi:stearoyl-CoA desaturase (delta-9 desaturase)
MTSRFLPENAVAQVGFHVAAALAPFTYSRAGLAAFLALGLATTLFGLVIGFHRLLGHRSFEAPRAVEYGLALCGVLAAQAGPARWVALHRWHHARADLPEDPHTPTRGFLWSYVAWTCFEDSVDPARLAPDVLADPFHAALERHRAAIVAASALALALLGWVLDGPVGAASLVVWGFFLRVVYGWHTVFLVNAFGHLGKAVAHTGDDRSRNVWWLALVAFGDNWHRNHHADPRSARVGRRWYELDLAYAVIALFASVGLAGGIRHRIT